MYAFQITAQIKKIKLSGQQVFCCPPFVSLFKHYRKIPASDLL